MLRDSHGTDDSMMRETTNLNVHVLCIYIPRSFLLTFAPCYIQTKRGKKEKKKKKQIDPQDTSSS